MDTTANSAAEPAAANAHVPIRFNRESSSASTVKGDTSSPTSQPATQTSTSKSSPLASRETSPGRPPMRSGAPRAASAAGSTRSRKSSSQETSPQRTSSKTTAPSASTSGKISSATTPSLGPVNTDATARVAAPQRSPVTAEHLKESPRWPVSPRLRSPPPTSMLNRPNLPPPRKGELEPPAIQVQRSSPPPPPQQQQQDSSQSDNDGDESHLQPGMRTPARGVSGSNSTTALETVEEVSPLASPQEGGGVMEKADDLTASEAGSQADHLEFSIHGAEKSQAPSTTNDSSSESGSVKGNRRRTSANVPPVLTSRQSSASTKKSKPSEGSVQHMTVETETVTSIPQHSLAPVAVKEGTSGTLRTKPSSETIRPKKEKKRPSRKQPNIGSGTASSKADIFEAKIASAVDEADSSDSEETFVYDSNPPDNNDRPRRFHSRTPSATSMVSQVDRNGLRSITNIMDNAAANAGTKRNMKFVNTFNSSGNESAMAEDDGKGTARSAAGSARGTGRVHHHHLGRWGRNGTNGHTSLFDNEAPFHISNTTTQRSKFSTNSNSSRQPSGPTSPRFLNSGRIASAGKRGMHAASYDLDDTTGTGADDERTPLLHGSVRSSRSGRTRRGQPVMLRSLEGQTYRRNPSVLNRFASCLVLTVMLLLVVSGAIGFMFATSQPLTDVELIAIKSVVAAEQELIFDIEVKAHNPNVVIVSIDQADIEVFAKSPHAGTDSGWWHRPDDHQGSDSRWYSNHGDMHAGEEFDGPVDEKAPNMRLGTIGRLDSALSFEGSFFNHGYSDSTGEVRLRAPGNGTIGGTARWERILQDEFDLIVKGVLKYSLPLSQHVRSAAISGRTTIKPNAANDPTGNGTEPITKPKKPE
ncbi:phospholipid metabolism enzyme regulator [Diaporthe amygdali]|uniref:phospholipid metabolism enzyme regulator n=1 Tax=Phomopsis amygdali TaxID=1214568 RepID=UPI0022FE1641|nr:phospholipid metabolism enzyme regulator [Diaporthe amygdali]KAJ0119218.1 phospholipid metabolism enzyme regulator [Diaporthe amygdali]